MPAIGNYAVYEIRKPQSGWSPSPIGVLLCLSPFIVGASYVACRHANIHCIDDVSKGHAILQDGLECNVLIRIDTVCFGCAVTDLARRIVTIPVNSICSNVNQCVWITYRIHVVCNPGGMIPDGNTIEHVWGICTSVDLGEDDA